MRTNDNIVYVSLMLSIIAILLSGLLLINVIQVGRATRELVKAVVIAQGTTDQLIPMMKDFASITKELVNRTDPLKEVKPHEH